MARSPATEHSTTRISRTVVSVAISVMALTLAVPAPAVAQALQNPGAHLEHGVSTALQPGEDFFAFANSDWLAATELPQGKERWGARNEIEEIARQRVAKLLDDAATAPAGSTARKVADYRAAYLNSFRHRGERDRAAHAAARQHRAHCRQALPHSHARRRSPCRRGSAQLGDLQLVTRSRALRRGKHPRRAELRRVPRTGRAWSARSRELHRRRLRQGSAPHGVSAIHRSSAGARGIRSRGRARGAGDGARDRARAHSRDGRVIRERSQRGFALDARRACAPRAGDGLGCVL